PAPGVWPLVAFKILLVAAALGLLGRARRLALFDILVVVMFGLMAATRVRNIGLFVVAALPIVLDTFAALGRSVNTPARLGMRRAAAAGVAIVSLGVLAVAGTVVDGAWYASNRRPMRFGFGESPAVFPIATTETLMGARLDGPLFNTL